MDIFLIKIYEFVIQPNMKFPLKNQALLDNFF